tara:strand:+ start:5157 stop:6107 length:951 start_codon:yes stop_codon:yes gene_type:complete
MGQTICSCANPAFPVLGRPDCVLEMRAVAFPIIIPRYKADGVTRNTIDLTSATLGQDIKDLIATSTALLSRIYPFPRCENITFERTETVYETAPSTRKYKIPNVGGVRTIKFETWGKDAVHEILRQLKVLGCSDVDFFLPDVSGSLWGILDSPLDTVMRGYEMATETFDSFKDYATDTTTQKLMISWDLDNAECEENAYGISSEVLGYSATILKPLTPAYVKLVELDATTVQFSVIEPDGSFAGSPVIGLVAGGATFGVVSDTGVVNEIPPVVETSEGVYSYSHLDLEITIGDTVTGSVTLATGYDIASGSFVAIL